MDPTPSPPVLARWDLPGDAPFADRMAEVAVRRHQAARSGSLSPHLLFALLLGLWVVVALAVSPVLIVGAVIIAAAWLWSSIGAPRQLARRLRDLPTAHEPYTVTLDVEGYHVVGVSFADHLRWRVFQDVAIDGGFLVMARRGSKMLQLVPLETLDPGVEREWLASEVGRLITADAVHLPPET